MPTLLDRYLAGEHRETWAEMVAGVDRDGRPVDPADAEAVATETMRRVRRNVETVIERLSGRGYRFGFYPDGVRAVGWYPGPLVPPTARVGESIAALEERAGAVPLSLRAFWSEVGGVNLSGASEAWGDVVADPLWVESVESKGDSPEVAWHLGEFEDWEANVEEYGAEEVGPFVLPLAPDDLTKANTSGGAAYGIALPNARADAPFENEWHDVLFVEYLRIALMDWGGFPGLAPDDGNARVSPPEAPPAEVAFLLAGLLPF
jgi:hypothetical protein